ncbi:hypothetical protein B0H14DRAFT_2338089, partial [Mycena olivaceomarginata]
CAIQALGDSDPKKGEHLVLWDLMLVIEFPLLILILSATLSHTNIPIQPCFLHSIHRRRTLPIH